MPDNVSAAALSIAILGEGVLRLCKTTSLITVEEEVEAMKKAGRT